MNTDGIQLHILLREEAVYFDHLELYEPRLSQLSQLSSGISIHNVDTGGARFA